MYKCSHTGCCGTGVPALESWSNISERPLRAEERAASQRHDLTTGNLTSMTTSGRLPAAKSVQIQDTIDDVEQSDDASSGLEEEVLRRQPTGSWSSVVN